MVDYPNPYDIPGALHFVGGSERYYSESVGVTVTYPEGMEVGDAIMLTVASQEGVNTPSGYQELITPVDAGGLYQLQIFWKLVEAADVGSTLSVVGTVVQHVTAQAIAVRGENGLLKGLKVEDHRDATNTGTVGDYEYITTYYEPSDGALSFFIWGTLEQFETDYASYNPDSGDYDGGWMYPTEAMYQPRLFGVWGYSTEGAYTGTRYDATSTDIANNAVVAIKMTVLNSYLFAAAADTIIATEEEDTSGSSYSDILTETTSFQTWSTLGGELIFQYYTDAFSLSDALEGKELLLWALTDEVRITELDYDPILGLGAAIAETIEMTPTLTGSYHGSIWERLAIQLVQQPGLTFGQALTDALSVAERIAGGEAITLSEALQLSTAVVVTRALSVTDALGLSPALLSTTKYGIDLADGVGLTAAPYNFYSGVLADTMQISPSQIVTYRARPTTSDQVNISEALGHKLVLRVVAEEGVELTAAETLNLIYRPELVEGIEITAGYVSPDDSFTTWVVNTLNGAVTNYEDFTFNSFARMGQKYIGASSDGIYELNGDDDAGTDIIATVKSGLAQMVGQSRFTQFRGAYLGVRSDVEGKHKFFMKLETGDGVERTYGVNVKNMETTKIHLGKGLRARYFSFELISTGQDFDLDTVEFVPILASRRV